MAKSIPIIDFDCYRVDRQEADEARLKTLVDNVHKALTTVGFMYVVNHGIPWEKIQELFCVSEKFFKLPEEEKGKYSQRNKDIPSIGGFYKQQEEKTSRDRHFDLKQSFNYSVSRAADTEWPESMPEFRRAMEDVFDRCIDIHNRILDVIGHALQLEDPQYFRKRHSGLGTKANCSYLRTLYYPEPDFSKIRENQIRCGEHTDLGGITLLFQDMTGGLEVVDVDGGWVKATPVEGAIVVNLGDLMQRWTGNKLIAGVHRVVLPTKPVARQSIVFFGKPDDDELIECIDGSDKFPPVTSLEYYKESCAHMYNF